MLGSAQNPGIWYDNPSMVARPAEIAEVAEVSEIPEIPEITEISEISEILEISGIPETSEIAQITEISEISYRRTAQIIFEGTVHELPRSLHLTVESLVRLH